MRKNKQHIKDVAGRFVLDYGLEKEITPDAIIEALGMQGYTVIGFSNGFNDHNVAFLLDSLALQEQARYSKGFTYADSKRRLVFLNENLSREEKLHVLLHEQGHIILNHLKRESIFGQDVMEEYEANEFVHYILHPTVLQHVHYFIRRHRKSTAFILLCAVLVCIGFLYI